MRNLFGKRVCVTGGSGFLGSFVVEQLSARGVKDVFVPRKRDYDLTSEAGMARMFRDAKPEIIFHLAAVVGGIGANRENPGRFFYENAIMGIQLIDAARRTGVEKLIIVGTVCSYPKFTPAPFKEESLWEGYPEETNAPYGIAKKVLLVQCQAYRQQYGLNAVYLLPVNLYGPRDNFDLESSHVIPALVRKFIEARNTGSGPVVVWGDGSATREFLYVEDATQGLLMAAESYNSPEPVNLGSGEEISIRKLSETVARICHYDGEIVWDTSRPNGQPRRQLDIARARQYFGFSARTTLEQGLQKTVEWYKRSIAMPLQHV